MNIISKESLLGARARFTAEVIDDSEELAEWAILSGVDLIDEVLAYRELYGTLPQFSVVNPNNTK